MKKLLFCFICTFVLTSCSGMANLPQQKQDELITLQSKLLEYEAEIERLENENSQLKFKLETQSFSSEQYRQVDEANSVKTLYKEDINYILSRFTQHYDELRSLTFYKDASSVESNNKNTLYAYIGVADSGKIWLRLKIQYSGEDWIYAERYTINTDTNSYVIVPEPYDMVRHHDATGIWELCDMDVTEAQLEMLYDIMNSNQTVVIYEGKADTVEYKVTAKEKFALQNIILAYDTLTSLYK